MALHRNPVLAIFPIISLSCFSLFLGLYSFHLLPSPAFHRPKYLCGPTLPLNSNSTYKQTALHAVITNLKLPDIKRATFPSRCRKTGKKSQGKRAPMFEPPPPLHSISSLKCNWEEKQIAMEEAHIFEGFHIALCWSKYSAAFVANCRDYL